MLQLRRMIDEVLDDLNISSLHLERGGNRNPMLVTECGIRVLNIMGITLPANLNKKDREYAFKLISNYLYKNKEDVLWVVDNLKHPINLNEASKYSISISEIGNRIFKNGMWVYDERKGLRLTLILDGNNSNKIIVMLKDYDNPSKWEYYFSNYKKHQIEDVFNKTSELITEMDKYIKTWKEYNKRQKKMAKITSCTI